MIIITPTTGNQTLKFIMHNYTTSNLVVLIKDAAQNINLLSITGTSLVTKNSYYNQLIANFTTAPVEGRSYEMLIALASDNIVFHKETLFCTAQPVDDYSINDGIYKMKDDYAAATDNQYAFYE